MTELSNEFIVQKFQANYPADFLSSDEPYGLLTVEVEKERIVEIIKWLSEDPELQFTFLTDLCGIHYPENKGKELGVIYHMHNLMKNVRIRIKAFFPGENPEINSLTGLFAAANWMERETYDFYGIKFTGHPDLRRILNVDEMDYFPLLKQYPLEDQAREDKEDKYFGR